MAIPIQQPAPADHPARRAEVERLLRTHGVPWEFRTRVPVHDLRVAPDSQVRINLAADPALVEQYAVGMKRGDIFPALVIEDGGRIVDGNTRHAALREADRDATPAYIIGRIDRAVRTLLAAELNQMNGARLTDTEQRLLAVQLRTQGMSINDISARLKRSTKSVTTWLRERDFARRCEALGIPEQALAIRAKALLVGLKNDAVFIETLKLVHDAQLSVEGLKPVLTALESCRSEREELDEVAAQRLALADDIQRISVGLKQKRRRNRAGKLTPPPATTGWNMVKGLLHISVPDLTDVSDDDARIMVGGYRKLVDHAGAVAAELGRRS